MKQGLRVLPMKVQGGMLEPIVWEIKFILDWRTWNLTGFRTFCPQSKHAKVQSHIFSLMCPVHLSLVD